MEEQNKLAAFIARDPVAAIMFAIAIFLIVLDGSFISVAAHTRNADLLKIPMLATGAFAVAGIVLGLVRSLRNAGKPLA